MLMFSIILIRIFDILISLYLLVLLLPLYLIISLLILIFDGKPIHYLSNRIGKLGKIFQIYKFRTMKVKYNNNQIDEITVLGKFLRRTSLDEIPQLINVIKNDMSIVGPRPLPHNIENNISKNLVSIRRTIKPGITGYAQINFNKKKRTWDEKIELDIIYIKNITILKYFYIIILTIPVIFRRFKFNFKGESL